MNKIKRKNYLPKKSFQIRLMTKIFVTLLIVVTILAGSIYFVNVKSLQTTKQEIQSCFSKFTSNDENELSGVKLIFEAKRLSNGLFVALNTLERHTYFAFIMAIAISLIIVVTVFLILTHRIAGSVYHFEKSLRALNDGDLNEQMHLRKGDEFQELADVFNDMSITLNQRLNECSKIIGDMKSTLIENKDLGERERTLLSENIGKMEEILGHFKLAGN